MGNLRGQVRTRWPIYLMVTIVNVALAPSLYRFDRNGSLALLRLATYTFVAKEEISMAFDEWWWWN